LRDYNLGIALFFKFSALQACTIMRARLINAQNGENNLWEIGLVEKASKKIQVTKKKKKIGEPGC
jgi:hypothetical protein